MTIPFSCSRWGQGGRGHQISDKPTFALGKGALGCWREGGREVEGSPSNVSQAHTCGLISRETFHTTTRHTAGDNSSQNLLQPLPVLARTDIGLTAGLALHSGRCEHLGSQTPSGDHIPAPALTAQQSLLSKKSWLALGFVTGRSPHRLQFCSGQKPLPLGSDQTHWPAGGGPTDTLTQVLAPLPEPDSNCKSEPPTPSP